MKLVTKNNYKFATGMFWQIADEGKRKINLSKLAKDTKHDMFCLIKTIKPTWGFCRKDELQGEKKVASLGKFIVEASKLSASYANSIICYKFKNVGELDDDGRILENDLYGYIVLLNGTICPEEGEYVSNLVMVRESIIQKAKKHEIETLYLPFEVALELFGIFVVLFDAVHHEDLLLKVMQNLGTKHQADLHDFIVHNLANHKDYLNLVNNPLTIDLQLVQELVIEPLFEKKLRETQDKNLKYLIPNIFILAHTSDEIYWLNTQFKQQFNKALIGSITRETYQKYKIVTLFGLIGVASYLSYSLANGHEREIKPQTPAKPPTPKPIAVAPVKLITLCLQSSDRFFKDLGSWTFMSLKCNSLGAVLTFNSDTDTTFGRFAELVGKNDKSIKLNARVGTYTIAYKINSPAIANISRESAIEQLQQAVLDYGIKVSIPQQSSRGKTIYKFSINAKQSPLFLFNHKVLDNVKLSQINMSFDRASGFYNWTLQGEF